MHVDNVRQYGDKPHPEGCYCDECNPAFHPAACLCEGFAKHIPDPDGPPGYQKSFACEGVVTVVPEAIRSMIRGAQVLARQMKRAGITVDQDRLAALHIRLKEGEGMKVQNKTLMELVADSIAYP